MIVALCFSFESYLAKLVLSKMRFNKMLLCWSCLGDLSLAGLVSWLRASLRLLTCLAESMGLIPCLSAFNLALISSQLNLSSL